MRPQDGGCCPDDPEPPGSRPRLGGAPVPGAGAQSMSLASLPRNPCDLHLFSPPHTPPGFPASQDHVLALLPCSRCSFLPKVPSLLLLLEVMLQCPRALCCPPMGAPRGKGRPPGRHNQLLRREHICREQRARMEPARREQVRSLGLLWGPRLVVPGKRTRLGLGL